MGLAFGQQVEFVIESAPTVLLVTD